MGKRQAECHPDKRVLARGLCQRCYHRWWRAEVAGQESRTLPEYRARVQAVRDSLGRSDMDHYATLSRHNITGIRYWEMYDQQDGKCAVCGNEETAKRNGKTQKLAIDHDHTCCPGEFSCGLCVRGLLCYRCNMMLGFGRDNPGTLMSAAIYLERTATHAG